MPSEKAMELASGYEWSVYGVEKLAEAIDTHAAEALADTMRVVEMAYEKLSYAVNFAKGVRDGTEDGTDENEDAHEAILELREALTAIAKLKEKA